jgi:peptide/nickel transport system substrate-binding protein
MDLMSTPRHHSMRWVMGLAVLVTVLLIACGTTAPPTLESPEATTAASEPTATAVARPSESTPTPAAGGPTATPRPTPTPGAVVSAKDTVILVTQAEPDQLDAWGQGCSGNVPSMVCEDIASDPLTWIDATSFEVVPLSGVESWEQTAPNRWRFHLREGVTFHNGEPWNAAAAKMGVDWHGDKDTAGHGTGAYGFHEVISGEVVDELTLDVVCDLNCPILPRTTMFTKFQAPEWYQSAPEGEKVARTIGIGPYKVVEWRPGVEVELSAFENYKPNNAYDAQAPAIKRAFQVWREEALVRASMIETGEADWAVDIGFENIEQAPKSITSTNNEIYLLVADTIWHPELRKKDVRKALALAIDCQTLMETLYEGLLECYGNISQEGTIGITPENSAPYPYNPVMARQLLQDAGYDPANEIIIHARVGRVYRDAELMEAVITMWRDVGVNARLQVLEESKAREARRSGCGNYAPEAHTCMNQPPPGPWGASTHYYESGTSNESLDFQRQALLRNSCGNVNTRVCDPSPGGLEEKIRDANATPLGPERTRKMEEIATIVHDEYYFYPFFQNVSVYGLAENLEWTARYDPRIRVNTMSFSQ